MQTAFRFLWRSDTRHIPTFLSNVQYFSMSQREQEWAYCVNAKLCLFKLTGWISALPLCLSPPSRGFSACQILLLTILENRGREKSVLVNSLSQLPSSAISLRTAGLFWGFFGFVFGAFLFCFVFSFIFFSEMLKSYGFPASSIVFPQ